MFVKHSKIFLRHIAWCVGMVMMIFAVHTIHTYAQAETVILSAEIYGTVNIRSGPDTRFAIVGQLEAGDLVDVLGKTDDQRWLFIQTNAQVYGWIPVFSAILEGDLASLSVTDGILVETTATATPSTNSPTSNVRVSSYGRTNVRSYPSMNSDIVGQLDVGQEAIATARSNNQNSWLFIEYQNFSGWVAYFTVRVRGNANTLPVLVPDSAGEVLIPPSRLIRTLFNTRLHPEPSLDSPTTLIVNFDEEVTSIARTSDNQWLFVGFDGQTGWGSAELFDVTLEEIRALPIYTDGVAVEGIPITPTRISDTVRRTATPTPIPTTESE